MKFGSLKSCFGQDYRPAFASRQSFSASPFHAFLLAVLVVAFSSTQCNSN
jgi:hypothetical protein